MSNNNYNILKNKIMNKNDIWQIRNIFNNGILMLTKASDSIDRKAQFWMGISLTGLIGIPSFMLQQDFGLASTIPLFAWFCWCFFLLVIFKLYMTLRLKIIDFGVSAIEIDLEPLKSDQSVEDYGLEQIKNASEAFTEAQKLHMEKTKWLSIAEQILFILIPSIVLIGIITTGLVSLLSEF